MPGEGYWDKPTRNIEINSTDESYASEAVSTPQGETVRFSEFSRMLHTHSVVEGSPLATEAKTPDVKVS